MVLTPSNLSGCAAWLRFSGCSQNTGGCIRGIEHPGSLACGKKAQRSCHGRVRTEAPRESRELDHIDFSVGSTSRSSHSVACKALWSRHQLPAPEVSPTSVRVYNLRSGIRNSTPRISRSPSVLTPRCAFCIHANPGWAPHCKQQVTRKDCSPFMVE